MALMRGGLCHKRGDLSYLGMSSWGLNCYRCSSSRAVAESCGSKPKLYFSGAVEFDATFVDSIFLVVSYPKKNMLRKYTLVVFHHGNLPILKLVKVTMLHEVDLLHVAFCKRYLKHSVVFCPTLALQSKKQINRWMIVIILTPAMLPVASEVNITWRDFYQGY